MMASCAPAHLRTSKGLVSHTGPFLFGEEGYDADDGKS